jgi:predicted nucleic acid-binding protein
MELLSWANANDAQLVVLQEYVSSSFEFSLDEPVILQAITLRKAYNIKLPDAIIAATALIHDLTLLTRNVGDFNKIEGLKVINPHEK